MTSKPNAHKKKILFIIPGILIALCIAFFLFYSYFKVSDNSRLDAFRLVYGYTDSANIDSFKAGVSEKFGLDLKKYNSLSSRFSDENIFLTDTVSIIPGFCDQSDLYDSDDYIICQSGLYIYIYAGSEDLFDIACTRFLNECVDEEGRIKENDDFSIVSGSSSFYSDLWINDTGISVYHISYPSAPYKEAALKLQYYIAGSTGVMCEIKEEENPSENSLRITEFEDDNAYIYASDSCIYLTSKATDLSSAVDIFANRYLGWYNAGHEDGHFSKSTENSHVFVEEKEENAWISKREPIITLWNINYPRGFYLNTDVSLENDIMSFSDDQLFDYVRMMFSLGYTGIQVTDMCSAWSGAGGYESVQEKIRVLFDAAHDLGMNTTLWVWGAEFTGYGWTDPEMTITLNDTDVRSNPDAQKIFDKYYSIYAELADCTDRLIAHFYDPGVLADSEDIAFYAGMLRDKFKEVNPDVDFGINCWGDKFDINLIVNTLGSDITIYEGTQKNGESGYTDFRSKVASLGARLGTWSWGNCEMEIDQLAQMNYNADIIYETYTIAGNYDSVYTTEYWSEMDSNHLLNLFSHYVAAQMLKDPELDTDTLTYEISLKTVGPEYAEDFSKVLRLIEKARSGSSYDTFFWSNDDYILLSDDYPAEEILTESADAIALLNTIISSGQESYSLPLPISLSDLLSLIIPEIKQIQEFAQFRISLDELAAECTLNAEYSEDELASLNSKLYEIGEPISEYNTVIGSWGQIEARAQQLLVTDFAERFGLERPVYSWYDRLWTQRILSSFAMYQRGQDAPVIQYSPYYQYGYAIEKAQTDRIIESLIEDGTLTKAEGTGVYLTDWESYKYMTNY